MTCRGLASAIAIVLILLVEQGTAEGGGMPFGKEPGSWYIGGTAGLSGIDSLRGFIDSLFYEKAARNLDLNLPAEGQKVIYGVDDRVEVYAVTDPQLLKLAQAACVQILPSEFTDNGDGTYTLHTVPWTTIGGYPLCEGERFVGQRRLGYGSAFLVAPDIVVTAGHAVYTCSGNAFLFGYQQVDSLTPPAMVVSEDDVYFCAEIIDQIPSGDYDHCVVRLDRPVVGRTPIPIRRSGLVPNGAPLVVVGHPSQLPMKVAAGAEVKDNRPDLPWFQANTDTYGGNSGSMVVNTDTWEIEGILVRGATDFIIKNDCASSYEIPNSGNPAQGLQFEEITKIGTFAHLIPEIVTSAGEVLLGSAAFTCEDGLDIELRDLDLAGLLSNDLLVITTASDSEVVTVVEQPPGSAIFTGSLELTEGLVSNYNGRLEVADGDVIAVVYDDADNGAGSPAIVAVSAPVDCQAPSTSNVQVMDVGATWVTVSFDTDESARGRVWLGESCGDFIGSVVGHEGVTHDLTVVSLLPLTQYRFLVEAEDAAGNVGQDDNAAACYDVTTAASRDFFTEQFRNYFDLRGKELAFVPDGSRDFYKACRFSVSGYPTPTDGATVLTLGDDDFATVELTGGRQVFLYGIGYSTLYVGSNGYVTFEAGDKDFSETPDEHLEFPPRVSVFWDDLDPTAGGQVSYQQLDNRLVVTWDNVPKYYYSSDLVRVQAELYFDGSITLSYPLVRPNAAVVGLSPGIGAPGTGVPLDYTGSNLSGYAACQSGACCEGQVGDANMFGGDTPTISDVAHLVDHLFMSGTALECLQEADVNQSGGRYPTLADITISDVSTLVDHLFISGTPLKECL